MLSPKEVSERLHLSKEQVRRWCALGIIDCLTIERGSGKFFQIPEEEYQKLAKMMYPYGFPPDWCAPITQAQLSTHLAGVKVCWAPALVDWGLLKAGKNPLGALIIKDIHEVEKARNRLADAPGVVDICSAYTTYDTDIVDCVEMLLKKSGVISDTT